MKTRTLLVIIICAAGVASAGLVCIVFLSFPPPALSSLQELLSRADDYLARSYLNEAGEAVARASRTVFSAEEMTRVLKRQDRLARATGQYVPYRDFAIRASEQYPQRAELCIAAVYACLRAGDPAQAERLGNRFPSLPAIQSLLAEARLIVDGPADRRAPVSAVHVSRSLELSGSPDPESLITAGRELKDDRYFLDAALAWLGRGQTREAHLTAGKYLLPPEYDEPAGLIAYEAGDFHTAAARLAGAARRRGRSDLFIIAGDSLLSAGDSSGAARLFADAIRAEDAFSPIPYIRLARLSREGGRSAEAILWLERAASAFPVDKNTIAEFASLAFERGEPDAARRALDRYLAVEPDDADMLALRLRFERDSLSSERFLSRLRQYYFDHPRNARLAEILVAALFANRDAAGARTVLLHFLEMNGSPPTAWVATSLGVLEALNGNNAIASEHFSQAIRLRDSYEYRYNRAVVRAADGAFQEAEEDLDQALRLVRQGPGATRATVIIHIRLSQVHMGLGDEARARHDLEEALRLDPDNPEAYRLLLTSGKPLP